MPFDSCRRIDGELPAADGGAGHPSAHKVESVTIEQALTTARATAVDIPHVIGGREVRTGRTAPVVAPHDHHRPLGVVHWGTAAEAEAAINTALTAARDWHRQDWSQRVQPFRRAAELLAAGEWRDRLVAAAMLELSKTHGQADGDAAAETIDLLLAGIANLETAYAVQPDSVDGVTNTLDYRPLEGFVFAVSPFNYASMSHLAFGPALLGNTVVWKPAESASWSAYLTLELLRVAGLPDGVINLVHGNGAEIGGTVLTHPELAAVHFTGSTATFQQIFTTVGTNIAGYRSYPRVVGETGGKGFVVVHPSADVDALTDAVVHGAFDYQGQKCSAASRLFVPRSLWPTVRDQLLDRTAQLRMGDPTEPGIQIGAVINARQFAKHEAALAQARAEGLVLTGGHTDAQVGWFVEPTVLQVDDPQSPFLTEELFAPVTAALVYDDSDWAKTLHLVDNSTGYGLTGAVFATDEHAITEADDILRYTAGNYVINSHPTGAVVGQQPFGGARASGTNDKVGTVWNTIRFLSPRSVKRVASRSSTTSQPV